MSLLIQTIANKIGVSGLLLLSICQVETGLKNIGNFQDGHGGSIGICQVSVGAARSINPSLDLISLYQIDVNITIAGLYLKQLIEKYGVWGGVSAYNAGSARIKNGEYINQKYVDRVKLVYYSNSEVENNGN